MNRSHRNLGGVAIAFGCLLAAACGRHGADEQPPREPARPATTGAPSTTTGASMSGCPMGVAGASTTVTDVEGGVALTITAPADQLGELRARAQRMSERARTGGAMGACSCPMMADAGAGGGMHGMMHMPPSDVRVDDVEGGVRITLIARDPKDVATLREHVRTHAEHMKSGHCGK